MYKNVSSFNLSRPIVAQVHKCLTVTRWLWVRSTFGGMIYYLLIFLFLRSGISAALSSATQQAMPRKIRQKVGNVVS